MVLYLMGKGKIGKIAAIEFEKQLPTLFHFLDPGSGYSDVTSTIHELWCLVGKTEKQQL